VITRIFLKSLSEKLLASCGSDTLADGAAVTGCNSQPTLFAVTANS